MTIEVVKLRKRGSGLGYYSYEVTIPKEFIEKLGWKPGERLLLVLEEDKIVVKKAEI